MSRRRSLLMALLVKSETIVFSKSSWSVSSVSVNQDIIKTTDYAGYTNGVTYRLSFNYDITVNSSISSDIATIRVVNSGAFSTTSAIVSCAGVGRYTGTASVDVLAKAAGGMLLRLYIASTLNVSATITNIKVIALL